jgi:hypothetical protein
MWRKMKMELILLTKLYSPSNTSINAALMVFEKARRMTGSRHQSTKAFVISSGFTLAPLILMFQCLGDVKICSKISAKRRPRERNLEEDLNAMVKWMKSKGLTMCQVGSCWREDRLIVLSMLIELTSVLVDSVGTHCRSCHDHTDTIIGSL